MYFSQQESGQSTLCEHLIGLTAGEDEEEEEDRWGGGLELRRGNKDMGEK